ncbi:hypothetical protein PTMSG1_08378 [Pyrenophora teres f. maculata]|nr:hypothetical protein PTMSG1_08378 [Pyrenophora teres f. maculata]
MKMSMLGLLCLASLAACNKGHKNCQRLTTCTSSQSACIQKDTCTWLIPNEWHNVDRCTALQMGFCHGGECNSNGCYVWCCP